MFSKIIKICFAGLIFSLFSACATSDSTTSHDLDNLGVDESYEGTTDMDGGLDNDFANPSAEDSPDYYEEGDGSNMLQEGLGDDSFNDDFEEDNDDKKAKKK